jgi:hypothetical protein
MGSLVSSVFGKKTKGKQSSTSVTTIPRMSRKELLTLNLQIDSARQQLDAIKKFRNWSNQQFQQFIPVLRNEVNKFLPQQQQITAESLGFAREQIGKQGELLGTAMDQIRRGTELTPQQRELIESSANSAIQSGLSDISSFRDESLRKLAQETAIGRGLRPEDTPILDVGGRVINESSRQASQLISGVRGQEAQQKLAYPIQAGNYIAGLTQAQQTQAASTANFAEQLRQQAFNNRLNLTQVVGQQGTQRAAMAVSPAASELQLRERLAQPTTNTEGTASASNSPSIFDAITSVAGAVGGFLTPAPAGGGGGGFSNPSALGLY